MGSSTTGLVSKSYATGNDEAKWDAECRRYLEHGALNDDGANGRIVEEQIGEIVAQALDIFSQFDSLLSIETVELAVHASHGTDRASSDAQLRLNLARSA
jgi:hypothetical protein